MDSIEVIGFISMYDDAEDLIKALKSGSSAKMSLDDTQGETKELSFRLRGSHSAISKMMSKDQCNLSCEEIVIPELLPVIQGPVVTP